MKQLMIFFMFFTQICINIVFGQYVEIPSDQYKPSRFEEVLYNRNVWDNRSYYTLPGLKNSDYFLKAGGFYKNEPNREKPPLRFGKVAAQFGMGVIGNWITNVAAIPWFENTRVKGDAGYNPDRHKLMFVSSIIGTSLGIWVKVKVHT